MEKSRLEGGKKFHEDGKAKVDSYSMKGAASRTRKGTVAPEREKEKEREKSNEKEGDRKSKAKRRERRVRQPPA